MKRDGEVLYQIDSRVAVGGRKGVSAIVDGINISQDPDWNRFKVLSSQPVDLCEIGLYSIDCSKKQYRHSHIFLRTARTDSREHIFCYLHGQTISMETVFVYDAHGQNGVPLSYWDPNAEFLADTQTPEHEWPDYYENPVSVETREIRCRRANRTE